MQIVFIFIFAFLILFPVFLAWLKGDQILDHIQALRQQIRKHQRHRSTYTLPVRKKVLENLLETETQQDQIDDNIRGTLVAFRQLSENRSIPDSSQNLIVVDELEKILLTRESYFNKYIDMAWLQSKTLELLIREVDLLRRLADLPAGWPEEKNESFNTPPAQRLLQNLNIATKKRAAADHKLNNIWPSKLNTSS